MEQIKMNFENGMKLINEMDKIFERWKKIVGYDNYSVSTFGRVRNDKFQKILKNQTNKIGYYYVNLCKKRQMKTITIHRLVANAFIKNPEAKKCVDHINGIRKDNNISNLRYATYSENSHNQSRHVNNTSGVVGVCWDKRTSKWYAQIQINGKNNHIGYYSTLENAKLARVKKANEIFGRYTHSSEKICGQ